jgi:hypothetical protein
MPDNYSAHLDDGKVIGPMSEADMAVVMRQQIVNGDTFVSKNNGKPCQAALYSEFSGIVTGEPNPNKTFQSNAPSETLKPNKKPMVQDHKGPHIRSLNRRRIEKSPSKTNKVPWVIGAVIIFILLCVAFGGPSEEEKRQYPAAIQKVLSLDSATTSGNAGLTVIAMESIDLSNCPSDFRSAYRKHIQAWKDEAEVMATAQRLGGQGLTDDQKTQAAILLTAEWAKRKKLVNSTFEEVERIAAKYKSGQ